MGAADEIAVRTWVQYVHLDKLYGHLPGMAASQARLFGLDDATYERLRAEFDAAARGVADELLADPTVGAAIDALPVAPGDTVVAVGDSITDDLQSWAEILRHVLASHHPDVQLVNAGLSAHTTAMVLRSWPARLATARPQLVLCCLGGNDVTRTGGRGSKPQVSPDESVANLRRLRELADDAGVRAWSWLSPTTVDEERVDAYGPFRFGQSSWRNHDIHALTSAMRSGLPGPMVDLTRVFGDPAGPDLVGPDGVHPTLEGQRAIATAVIEHLAER